MSILGANRVDKEQLDDWFEIRLLIDGVRRDAWLSFESWRKYFRTGGGKHLVSRDKKAAHAIFELVYDYVLSLDALYRLIQDHIYAHLSAYPERMRGPKSYWPEGIWQMTPEEIAGSAKKGLHETIKDIKQIYSSLTTRGGKFKDSPNNYVSALSFFDSPQYGIDLRDIFPSNEYYDMRQDEMIKAIKRRVVDTA